tara:strand:+ start:6249 stop:6533 length:285 start_codon:yes stop_codon:yes gene_type:complete
MTGKFEIIGTNEPLNYLKGKNFNGEIIHKDNVHSMTLFTEGDDSDKEYCFEVKDMLVKEDFIIINGWASDKDLNIGKICVVFKPESKTNKNEGN